MTLHHKPLRRDVEEAFERFARLCPGTAPKLDVDAPQEGELGPTFYTVRDSRTPLDGQAIAGHRTALAALSLYIEARTEGVR